MGGVISSGNVWAAKPVEEFSAPIQTVNISVDNPTENQEYAFFGLDLIEHSRKKAELHSACCRSVKLPVPKSQVGFTYVLSLWEVKDRLNIAGSNANTDLDTYAIDWSLAQVSVADADGRATVRFQIDNRPDLRNDVGSELTPSGVFRHANGFSGGLSSVVSISHGGSGRLDGPADEYETCETCDQLPDSEIYSIVSGSGGSDARHIALTALIIAISAGTVGVLGQRLASIGYGPRIVNKSDHQSRNSDKANEG